jgi:hypothetical protein
MNAQSVVGKVNELNALAADLEPDLILVTETWCNKDITDAYLTINGYEIQQDLRRDREDTRDGRGGGLLVHVKQGLKVLACDNIIAFHQHCKFEINNMTLHLVYRPPNSSHENLAQLENLIKSAGKNTLLIGDFNLPSADWEAGTALAGERGVLEVAEEMMMEQMVKFSTHLKGNILDLALTNMQERIVEVREEGRLGKSDHSNIVIEVSMGVKSVETGQDRPDWARADWDKARRILAEREWKHEIRRAGTEQAWQIFRAKMEEIVSECVPRRRRRNANRPPWLTQEVLRAIRKKKRL